MAGYVLTIGGVVVAPRAGHVEVDGQVEARTTAVFEVIVPSTTTFARGQPVTLKDPSNALVFGGRIDMPKRSRFDRPGGKVRWTLQCTDDHYLADKLIVARSWVGQTCGFMATDLVTTYLAAEGITAGNIEAGPVVTQHVVNYITCSKALDELARLANFTWWMFNSKLYFQSYLSTAAPWALTNADVNTPPAPVRNDASPLYRNRQYVKGFKDTTGALTETQHGDGIKRAFVLGFSVAALPSAISVNAVAKTLGIKGVDTGKDFYWAKGDPVLLQDAGGVVLLVADTLSITYLGMYEGITVSEDTSAVQALKAVEVTGTGHVDAVLDIPGATSHQAALDQAGKLLSLYAKLGNLLTFRTLRGGLAPGQLLTVTLPDLGYTSGTDKLLITAVKVTDSGGLDATRVPVLAYDVDAVAGPYNGSWVKFFERLVNPGLAIAGSGLATMLTVLASFTDAWAWTDSVVEVAHACFAANGVTLADGLSLACD